MRKPGRPPLTDAELELIAELSARRKRDVNAPTKQSQSSSASPGVPRKSESESRASAVSSQGGLMARSPTGQIIERHGKRGRSFGIRFRAYGRRHYLTLDVATEAEAKAELANVLPTSGGASGSPGRARDRSPAESPSFHAYASAWHAARKGIVKPRTSEWEKWALSSHLLPVLSLGALPRLTPAWFGPTSPQAGPRASSAPAASTRPSASSRSCSQRPSRTTC